MNAPLIEHVMDGDKPLAYLIRAAMAPDKTTFVTPDSFKQQVGFIVYKKGMEIPRHIHLPLERHLVGTSEVIFVRKGLCDADIYNDSKQCVKTLRLHEGDVLILIAGGHGFRVHEDTILLEVKQGPFVGLVEKERF